MSPCLELGLQMCTAAPWIQALMLAQRSPFPSPCPVLFCVTSAAVPRLYHRPLPLWGSTLLCLWYLEPWFSPAVPMNFTPHLSCNLQGRLGSSSAPRCHGAHLRTSSELAHCPRRVLLHAGSRFLAPEARLLPAWSLSGGVSSRHS